MSGAPFDMTWMQFAAAAASSSDPGRKVGSVIVNEFDECLGTGWTGVQHELGVQALSHRLARPERYLWSEHAERRAIGEAASKGFATAGATIYVTWFPCMDCARMIVGCRMKELVYGREPDLSDPKFGEDFKRVKPLLTEAGIKFRCEPCPE